METPTNSVDQRVVRRRHVLRRAVTRLPYARPTTNSLKLTSSVIQSNIAELSRNVRRFQRQICDSEMSSAEATSRLKLFSSKLAGHMIRATAWQHELDILLEEEEDKEVASMTGPEIDRLVTEFAVEKETAINEAKTEVRKCVICLTNDKSATIIPCSHTFCTECVEKMKKSEGSRCAFCRQRIFGLFPVLFTD